MCQSVNILCVVSRAEAEKVGLDGIEIHSLVILTVCLRFVNCVEFITFFKKTSGCSFWSLHHSNHRLASRLLIVAVPIAILLVLTAFIFIINTADPDVTWSTTVKCSGPHWLVSCSLHECILAIYNMNFNREEGIYCFLEVRDFFYVCFSLAFFFLLCQSKTFPEVTGCCT